MLNKLSFLLMGFGIGLMVSPNPKNSLLFVLGIVSAVIGVAIFVTSKENKKDKNADSN